MIGHLGDAAALAAEEAVEEGEDAALLAATALILEENVNLIDIVAVTNREYFSVLSCTKSDVDRNVCIYAVHV